MTEIKEVCSLAVCRVCLHGSEEEMISIYERDVTDLSMYIYEQIEQCAGIQILKEQDLPSRICFKCRGFLKVAHKFRTICTNSDNYLREFVCKATKVQYDDEDDGPEYLLEYPPELKSENTEDENTGDNILHAELEQSQNPVEFEEVEDYAELWLNENEDDLIEEDHNEIVEEPPVINSLNNERTEVATAVNKKSPKINQSKNTLVLTPDGEVLISAKKTQKIAKKEKQMHICDICGNSYPRKYALEAHMRRHRDERPFECEICKQAFHLNFQLTRHIRKHTGKRPYQCSYCDRCFTDRSTMVKHERIHRNERPYKCETCGKTFTYSSVLKVHMLTHTGEKPFTCGICGKRFARGHHLRAHLETILHASDPRVKTLIRQIKRDEEIEESTS